ncbi:MAG: zinc ribbon domain-containing protein [Firmicutes bacterium]|nr:zinc ribbon domain-containing protein [Bacillota bacterium]
MSDNRNPLNIYCRNCGAPAGFDILNQTYRCSHCGELTGIEEANTRVMEWKALHKENKCSNQDARTAEERNCPNCGAKVMFAEGEGSETCDFCGSKLARKKLLNPSRIPDIIIPFFITHEEARERMLNWGKAHKMTPEGRSIVSSMGNFRGYYLPYRLVRGPVQGLVKRNGGERLYNCKGFLNGTAVNTSQQLDNLVLNEMEPFDWSEARPFEFGYIAGHNVKLEDIPDAQIDRRIKDEVAEDFRPDVEKVMQTPELDLSVSTGKLMTVKALLPVYFIKSGKLTAVMNGQTGRIAVSKERKKKRALWAIEPSIITAVLTFLMGMWSHFNLEMMILSALVFSAIVFAIMGDGRKSIVRNIVYKSNTSKAKRDDGKLKIREGKDILTNSYDNTPVFYEEDKDGESVPVKIKFYSVGRWISIILRILIMVFLPLIIGAFLLWANLPEGASFSEVFHPEYGGAWYIITGFVALIYFVKGVRRDIYDHPLIYKILPNGKKRLMGKRRDRKIGILHMFGVGETDEDGKRVSLFRLLRDIGGAGVFIIIVFVGIFIGCVAAIAMP